MERAMASLTRAAVGPVPMLLYPLCRGRVPAPGLPTPAGSGMFFSFSILRTVRDDPALIAGALDHNRELARTAAGAGGTIYPVSAFPASTASG
jgi:hypothetical protein